MAVVNFTATVETKMALQKVKTEHSGAKNTDRSITRREAKKSSKKRRRRKGKLDPRFWTEIPNTVRYE